MSCMSQFESVQVVQLHEDRSIYYLEGAHVLDQLEHLLLLLFVSEAQ